MTHDKEIRIGEIKRYLPHRYPFLLVDKVLNWSQEGLTALKNVTYNEPFFSGHFPGHPIMPGVLIIEALAQACGILVFKAKNIDLEGRLFYLAAVDKVRFKKMVEPGDSLIMHVKILRTKHDIWRMQAEAEVEQVRVASAELTLVSREENSGG